MQCKCIDNSSNNGNFTLGRIYKVKEKLRHSLGRPSRSDFVQFEFSSDNIRYEAYYDKKQNAMIINKINSKEIDKIKNVF